MTTLTVLEKNYLKYLILGHSDDRIQNLLNLTEVDLIKIKYCILCKTKSTDDLELGIWAYENSTLILDSGCQDILQGRK